MAKVGKLPDKYPQIGFRQGPEQTVQQRAAAQTGLKILLAAGANLLLCQGLLSASFLPIALAKGAKAPAKAVQKQVIYSLSQEQQDSKVLKVWGVPACVLTGGEKPRGLCITGITGDGLANEFGLEVGDVLLSLNGHVLMDAVQADELLARTKSGPLKAVVARPANVLGGIIWLSPTVNFVAHVIGHAYTGEGARNKYAVPEERAKPSDLTIDALEDYMFNLINEDRAANGGLPPLAKSSKLGALARKYAEDLHKRRFFGHDDPDGLDPKGRARRDGIYESVWENLTTQTGGGNYKQLVLRGEQSMMSEPPNMLNHRGNILHNHHCVGVGVSAAGGTIWAVQEFSPSDIP